MDSSRPPPDIHPAPQMPPLPRDFGFWHGRWVSFQAALAGTRYTLRTQPNVWIELAAAVVVTLAGWCFQITALEWALLGFTVMLVLALEAINTAIEAIVDLVSPTYHPLAKIAKDAAAAAMIFVVVGSCFVALAIFGPRIWAQLG